MHAATSQRIASAGNVAGELLNWIAMLGAIGTRTPSFLEPQVEHGHAYGQQAWDSSMANYVQRIHDPGSSA